MQETKNNTNIYPSINKYSGNKNENIKEWLFQFESMIKLNVGYTENNIITIASMHLTGSAFNYFDDLTEKPTTWSAIKLKLIERFGS
ncbi:hypothetical protein GVAV_001252 [Gurleya vavrai]